MPVLLLGSCFAENIGNAMLQRRFPVRVNPFGTVYNPLSVAQSLERLRSAQPFNDHGKSFCRKSPLSVVREGKAHGLKSTGGGKRIYPLRHAQ